MEKTPEEKALAIAQSRKGPRAFARRITGEPGGPGWFRICRPLAHHPAEIIEWWDPFFVD